MTAPARDGPDRRLLAHNDILDLVIRSAALPDILEVLAAMLEAEIPGARAAVLLLDEAGERLTFAAGPSLPPEYIDFVDNTVVGPDVGTGGRAVYENRVVITPDVTADPAWRHYRARATALDLAACWSTPFVGQRGRVLGCFAVYFDRPRTPDDAELALLHDAGYLAAVTVQHDAVRQLLRDTSRTHPLTGIANRVVLTEWLRAVEAEAGEAGHRFAVIQISIEGIGTINESLGPTIGDEVLRVVASRLTEAVGATGLAAHLWGSEFAVVVRAASDDEAVVIAEGLRDALAEPLDVAGVTLVVGATMGVVSYGAEVLDLPLPADEPLRAANVALQRAKAGGAQQIGVYDPRADPGADVVRLAPALRRGLDQEEFTVAYQPIVRLADEGIDHYEALLRWTTPAGAVPPDSFVTVAERTGMVGDLGRYALERALAELAAIRAAGRADVGMSVNLSVRQLAEDGLAELIATLLDRYNLPAPCVTMEVTEGVLLDATGRGWSALDGVRELGVQIALDDFGTGYSQLPYLRQFAFDEIKIDQSFVAAMHEDLRAKALIAGAITFAQVAGIRVVAEGIERRDQAEELRELGCTHGQGYLFGAATRSPSTNGRRRPRPGPGAQPGVDQQRE